MTSSPFGSVYFSNLILGVACAPAVTANANGSRQAHPIRRECIVDPHVKKSAIGQISHQPSAVSHQPSAISQRTLAQPLKVARLLHFFPLCTGGSILDLDSGSNELV